MNYNQSGVRMNTLVLNGDIAFNNIETDRKIFSIFKGYCVQYTRIPDNLYLANPVYGVANAIVLVDCSDRNMPDVRDERILVSFHHPILPTSMLITCSGDFETVFHVEYPDDEMLAKFGVDSNNPPTTEAFFGKLLETYRAEVIVGAALRNKLIQRYTLPIEQLSF